MSITVLTYAVSRRKSTIGGSNMTAIAIILIHAAEDLLLALVHEHLHHFRKTKMGGMEIEIQYLPNARPVQQIVTGDDSTISMTYMM